MTPISTFLLDYFLPQGDNFLVYFEDPENNIAIDETIKTIQKYTPDIKLISYGSNEFYLLSRIPSITNVIFVAHGSQAGNRTNNNFLTWKDLAGLANNINGDKYYFIN